MSITESKKEIFYMLLKACKKSISRIEIDLSSEQIYAFVIYPSLGFRGFGIAVSSRESLMDLGHDTNLGFDDELLQSLKNHPDLLEKAQKYLVQKYYIETTACEWKYSSIYDGDFNSVNMFLANNYDKFYEEGIESQKIYSFFLDIVLDVLMTLKKEGAFKANCFEKDLLLGMQFPDTSNLDMVEEVSKKVNSKLWHRKIQEVCKEIKEKNY